MLFQCGSDEPYLVRCECSGLPALVGAVKFRAVNEGTPAQCSEL
jgi:hypothetical protein